MSRLGDKAAEWQASGCPTRHAGRPSVMRFDFCQQVEGLGRPFTRSRTSCAAAAASSAWTELIVNLQDLPAARVPHVRRATELVQDERYPTVAILEATAWLLAQYVT